MSTRPTALLIATLLAIAASLFACTGKPEVDVATPASSQQSAKPIDPATTATITGVVNLTGAVPKPATIDMSSDPACNGQNASESVVVNNGKLANVFVYVKDGLGNYGGWTTAGPPAIQQKGCRYLPHVIGVMAGQSVTILNQDPTMHNIHPMPKENREWNVAQASGAQPLIKKFDHPELMIPIKCNQHPWMRMYVNVVSNPFFAVTDSSGSFELKGLPPGTYTIAAIHEIFGEQTQQITVGPKEAKPANFSFSSEKGASAAK
jgi:plastocyanin